MRLAFSNIALPSFDQEKHFGRLAEQGFEGIEVAPSKIFQDTRNVRPKDVDAYRKSLERFGLEAIGMHSLFYDQPHLNLFSEEHSRSEMLRFLGHQAQVCRDLGGTFLVYGSPSSRRPMGLDAQSADACAVDFFARFCRLAEPIGVQLLLEALAPDEAEYLHTLGHAAVLIEQVGHPCLGMHFDAKAAAAVHELNEKTVNAYVHRLIHVHANEEGLGVLKGDTGVDHALLGSLLKNAGYEGWVSLEQRICDSMDIETPLLRSLEVLQARYQ